MRAQKARSHASGVRDFFLKNGAIRCNLVHSRAHFSPHYFAVFRSFVLNVVFADKSENKEKKEP